MNGETKWRMNRLSTQKRFKIHKLSAKQQQAIISLSSQTIETNPIEHGVGTQNTTHIETRRLKH